MSCIKCAIVQIQGMASLQGLIRLAVLCCAGLSMDGACVGQQACCAAPCCDAKVHTCFSEHPGYVASCYGDAHCLPMVVVRWWGVPASLSTAGTFCALRIDVRSVSCLMVAVL